MGEPSGGGQFRARSYQPLADHRDDEIPLAAALTAEQPLEVQAAQHPEDRSDVTVRQGPLDLEVLVKVDQPPAGEHRADHVDDLDREVREVPEVLVANPPVLVAVGTTQELGRVHRPVLPFRPNCGYVSRATTFRHHNRINHPSDGYQA